MFYAAKNLYSSPTSIGFSNTWCVMGFPSRSMRDDYVKKCPNLATRAIKADQIRKYGGKPKQVNFFDGQGRYYVHMGRGEFFLHSDS